jgi:hypothetical protein
MQVDRAYKILSDPEKRNLYDTYGEQAVEFYENDMLSDTQRKIMLYLVNPQLTNVVCLALLALFALVTLAPTFLTLRLDDTVTWSWSVVLVPMWILDAIVLVVVGAFTVLLVQAARSMNADAESGDEEEPILSTPDKPIGMCTHTHTHTHTTREIEVEVEIEID